MIDVHILIHGEPQWQVDRCLASLEGQPVNVHIVEGVKERVEIAGGRWTPYTGRVKGFSLGSAKYVSLVDPDDWVEPGAFDLLLEEAEAAQYLLTYGWENVIKGGQVVDVIKYPHHAFLLHRDALPRIDAGFGIFSVAVFNLDDIFGSGGWKEVKKPLYNWVRDNG